MNEYTIVCYSNDTKQAYMWHKYGKSPEDAVATLYNDLVDADRDDQIVVEVLVGHHEGVFTDDCIASVRDIVE